MGNVQTQGIMLKNEGAVPATVQFDALKSDAFHFVSPLTVIIEGKNYRTFNIRYEPKEIKSNKYTLTLNTVHNPYESQKVMLLGEGYTESVILEDLPNNTEDELDFGDCIIKHTKRLKLTISNKTENTWKFEWLNTRAELKLIPSTGHLGGLKSKEISVLMRSEAEVQLEEEITCNITQIELEGEEEGGWDDSITETRMVRPSEHAGVMKKREEEAKRKAEEIEAALAAKEKAKGKAPPKKEVKKDKKDKKEEEEIKIDMSEEPTMELEDVIPEPLHSVIDKTEKTIMLKCKGVADYPKFQCEIDNIMFKPTLMYQTRSFKFSLKNVSLIALNYLFKIVDAQSGVRNEGPYTIIPKKGSIAAGL